MSAAPLRVAIVTNVLPSYRQGFYDRLFAREDLAVTVYCQPAIRGVNVRSIHDRYPGHVRLTRAVGLAAEKLVWQSVPWKELLRDVDVVFVDGNPRIVSHALLASVRRLLGRPVVLWTMGHSWAASPVTEAIRLGWTRMFRSIFLYADAEIAYLRGRGFATQDLSAMNNGLDQAMIDRVAAAWDPQRLTDWQRARDLAGRTVVLSCARLDPKNRFDLMVKALPSVLRQVPDAIWCCIGDGPEAASLERAVGEAGLADHVRFAGAIYDEGALAPWFLSAAVFAHPAAIGLSLLHAFGYGVPVVTHGNALRHGPEFSAFTDGAVGRTFEEGDGSSLAARLVEVVLDPDRPAMRQHALHVARTQYNTDVMVERFAAAAWRASGADTPARQSDRQ